MSSILRSKIIDILNASVGQYCHGIDKDHISVSVFNGEVRISDVAIKQDSFIHHGLPFSVSAGRVGSLVVLIPWASLSSQPIDIHMSDLVLDICDSGVDTHGAISKNLDERAIKSKEANLAGDTLRRAALLRAQGSSGADNATAELGRMGTLLAGAVKNLNCSLTNLTIRYTTSDGSSFVFHIDSLSLMNVDENLKQAFLSVQSVTRKCCQLEGLSLMSSSASAISCPILEPISSKLILSFDSGADARLLISDLSLNVDSALVPVLVDITASGKLRIAQSRCASSRPSVPVRGNSRVWWRYVFACVVTMVAPQALKIRRLNRKISHYLKDYCRIYIKILLGDEDPELLTQLQAIEADLHADLICRFRDRCVAIIQSRGLLARKAQAASASRGGWFGKLLSSSPNQPFLSEEELRALSELSLAPDSQVLQHDATQPAAAVDAAHFGYKASVEFESFSVNFFDSNLPSFSAAISKFSAGVSFVDNKLSASCVLHRLKLCDSSPSKRGQYIASSSLHECDAADQLVIRACSSPDSTSISGKVSGIDVIINADSLALLSRWLDKARVISMHSSREVHAHGDSESSSVSLKLVAMHIQRSPQIEVDLSWQAPTVKLELASGTLCLFLGHFTLTSSPADDDGASPEVCPPALHSSVPHFFAGSYPCPSAIYHRFQLSLVDFTLGISDAQLPGTDPVQMQSQDGLQRIIAPTSAQLSFSFVRGEFMEQNWPFSQVSATCNSVSLEIRPCYCTAFNDAISMFIKLFADSSASKYDTIEEEVSLSISSYSHIDDDGPPSSDAPARASAVLFFVSNVPTVSVRILGHDLSRSDCSLVFLSSKTSLVLRSADVEAYMSVMQVKCCNNLLSASCPPHIILSVDGGASQAASLLHFWYAEKGSSLWSDTTMIATKTITSSGPSLGLSLDCADAAFNIDLYRSQGLLALISDNLDAFSASIKDDLSRKMESLITEVKQQMSTSGSAFSLEGKFSKLITHLFSGSESVSVLSAELCRSSLKLVFSQGSALDFSVSSDAFKVSDCTTSECKTPHVIIESDSSQSLQLSGRVSGESLTVTAALSKFQSNLFAPSVAKIWCLLFPPNTLASESHSASSSTAAASKVIDISLVFNGAEILFSDRFMSRSGFLLTAPTMRLSCNVQGDKLTTIELLEGADAFRIDAVVDDIAMQVVRSDGSMCFTLQPSRFDLHCPVKTLSLYVSDRLFDYAIPFLSNVLGPAVAVFNAEEFVDQMLQQHGGKDFSITTGASSLRLYLGDSSPSQLFFPLFDVEAVHANSKLDITNETRDGAQVRNIKFEMCVANVEARYSFEGRQCTVLTCPKSSSNLFSFGGTIANTLQPNSFSGDVHLHCEPVLLQVDDRALSLFIRVFANVLSAISTSDSTVSSKTSAPAASSLYSIGFNATFGGLSVELSLNDTISGQFSSKMAVSCSFAQDSFKILSKCDGMRVMLMQRDVGGRQSTMQELLEGTSFNFSVKSDFPSREHSVMLSFLSPIVTNTSYTDIKRLYFTFELFLASFNSGMQSSRFRKNVSSSPKLTAVPTERSKLNVCLQADSLRFVFVNDCPPFCAPLLQLQLSKLSFDTCIKLGGPKPVVDWLKLSMAVALNHCINEAASCDDLLPAKNEIVFEEWSFAVSSQLLPNEPQSGPQADALRPLTDCQHIRFEASSLLEMNISHACVMSLVTAFARMHKDWTRWMLSKNASTEAPGSDVTGSPLDPSTPLSRMSRRFVFVSMRNETDISIAVAHQGNTPIVLSPHSDVSLDDTWTKLEFTLHVNGSSKVCIITPVPLLIEVGGAWVHVRSEDRQGQQFVVFRGALQVFNHTSLPFSLAMSSCASASFVVAPRSTTNRFRLSSICAAISGRVELTLATEGSSVSLAFADNESASVEAQLKAPTSVVRIHGRVAAGVLYVRILPLFSIASSLPMPLQVQLSHDSKGSTPHTSTVHPHALMDVCNAALAHGVWLAADASGGRHAPVFTPLFSSAFGSGSVPSLESTCVVLECAPLRHVLSISLHTDDVGVPVVSIFVAFIIKNCTHWPLDITLSSKPVHSAKALTSRTSCPPHSNGLHSTAVLGCEAPVVWGDGLDELSMKVNVAGCSKQASVSLASYEDKLMWLACPLQSDSGSCSLALCLQPEGERSTLVTIRYRVLFYNHTDMHVSFAIDPDLDVFTEVAPSCHSHLQQFAEPCRVVVRVRSADGPWTQVSSLIPVVSPSDCALSLVSHDAASGAVERTFYMRVLEVDGTVVAALSNFCDVQSSILVSNETTNIDAFVSLSTSPADKRIVCPASTVSLSTAALPPSSSMHVTLRSTGSAPGAESVDCSMGISDVGQHKPVTLSGRTLHVYIEPRHGMRHVIISDHPPQSPLFVIGSTAPKISFELDVPGFGVSCVDAQGCELLYVRLERVWFSWQQADEESLEVKILNFQVDGPLGCGPDVIVSRTSRPSPAAAGDGKTKPLLPAVHAVLVRSSSQWPREVARMQLLRSAIVCVQELRIDMHEAVVYKLLAFLLPFLSAAADIAASNKDTFSAADDRVVLLGIRRQLEKMQRQLVFVRLLVIHSISCLVSFTLAPNSEAVQAERAKYLKTGRSSKLLRTLLDIVGVGGIKEANVKINSLHIDNLFAPRQQLVTTLKTYFTSQLKGGALGFLGSLEALGNPKHLLMGYASAVSDIFIEPAASAVSSPKDVLSSMQHGTTSLLHNLVGSSLGSIASVSGAFSRGISSVTGDNRAVESAKIRSAGEGLKHGAQSLGKGLFSGITGVVTKPMEGARAGGGGFNLGGFMKGMASGVIGVVAQPVKGVADMISDVGKGIDSSTARLHGYKSMERLRAARPPSRWLTHPYNPDAAVASTFVRLWQGAAAPRPLMAVVFDLIGHSDWRCSVLAWHRPTVRDFSALDASQLQQLCKGKHLPTGGSRQELADRLAASEPSELIFGHLR